MYADKLNYAKVAAATSTVRDYPTGLFGIVAVTAGNVTVYDNTAASGDKLYEKTGLTAGEVVHFGGIGIAANKGLTVVASGTVNVIYG